MSNLSRFTVDIRPYVYAGTHGGHEIVYRFAVAYNEQVYQMEKIGPPPPYMDELEWLLRQVIDIKQKLKEEDDKRRSAQQISDAPKS